MSVELTHRRRTVAGLRWILSLVFLLSTQQTVAGEVRIHVIETDPPAPATLGHWEQFHLHIGYETDRPIRIYVEAFFGNQRTPSMTGGSPLYEPGSGETDVWIAYTEPVRVDKIVVRAEDKGTRVTQAELPVELTWTGIKSLTPRHPAPWVERIRVENERRYQAERQAYMNRPEPWWENALFFLLPWAVPGYFIVQIALLRRYRGGWRYAAAVPAVPMAGVLIYTVFALLAGSNLFPLVLIFVSPFALMYLLGLMAIRRVVLQNS
jgi:hypothetical protein